MHVRKWNQAWNHELVLKKFHRMIKSNQPYIDMNTNLTKKAKITFKKDFVKLMKDAALEKYGKCEKKIY